MSHALDEALERLEHACRSLNVESMAASSYFDALQPPAKTSWIAENRSSTVPVLNEQAQIHRTSSPLAIQEGRPSFGGGRLDQTLLQTEESDPSAEVPGTVWQKARRMVVRFLSALPGSGR